MMIPIATKTAGDVLPKLPIRNATTGSLYLHVPFCRKKCPYCHFYVAKYAEGRTSRFVNALLAEWENKKHILPTLESIYFGGGTPALLLPSSIKKILSHIGAAGEITIEANPEDITYDLMRGFQDAGINRVSIGVQSLDDSSLSILGRTHSAQKAIDAIENTYRAGIENISIDLMYDLPYQNLESFSKTLHRIETLPISHLSLYNLTIEENTQFYRKKESLQKTLPSDEESLAMLEYAADKLIAMGFNRYEISAFAKDKKLSHHNIGYWTGRPFIGLGPSAFSYLEGSRFQNIAHLEKYQERVFYGMDPIDFRETLAPKAHIRELLAIHLRLAEGINLDLFEMIPDDTLMQLEKLKEEGYLIKEESIYRLTPYGQKFYDEVAAELI